MVELSPDQSVLWQWGAVSINDTIAFTWIAMALLVTLAWRSTCNLSLIYPISKRQVFLETIISYMRKNIAEIVRRSPEPYLPFSGTLFLLLSISSLLGVVPGYIPPTGSLSTTAALAICVFFAVPFYGIMQQGVSNYFRRYTKPTVLMLPFNIIGELTRTIALALRLFGNMMSQTLLAAVIVSIAPLFVPIVMNLFGLLIGQVQAYIFSVLATVYIVSGSSISREGKENKSEGEA
jgi:F-type H+-transporting ATPase subunit a